MAARFLAVSIGVRHADRQFFDSDKAARRRIDVDVGDDIARHIEQGDLFVYAVDGAQRDHIGLMIRSDLIGLLAAVGLIDAHEQDTDDLFVKLVRISVIQHGLAVVFQLSLNGFWRFYVKAVGDHFTLAGVAHGKYRRDRHDDQCRNDQSYGYQRLFYSSLQLSQLAVTSVMMVVVMVVMMMVVMLLLLAFSDSAAAVLGSGFGFLLTLTLQLSQ